MDLLTDKIKQEIQNAIITNMQTKQYELASENINKMIDKLYAHIPDNKRISYGIVYTIKILSQYIFEKPDETKSPVFDIASALFQQSTDYKSKVVALGMLSFYGLTDYKKVLPYFEQAAAHEYWEVREISQMFFRKLIKKFPDQMHKFLLHLVKSKDSNIRRFVGETLRPVQENKWFYQNPDYSLSILRHLFKENVAYARTSVGNNLSDLAKQWPDLIYGLVRELVDSGDKNSYWIAYRACRNLVKKEPKKVMKLLKVKEYKYKKNVYKVMSKTL